MISAGSLHAENDLVKSFASCTGRYSAEMEHAWLISDPRADEFEARRLSFVALLDATVTPDTARQTLHYRINAKHAHAGLLQVARFNLDTSRANAARSAAARLLSQCDYLLLGGA